MTADPRHEPTPLPEAVVEIAPGIWGACPEAAAFSHDPVPLLPPRRVVSVLPAAFRRAARATPHPAGEGDVLEVLLEAARRDADLSDEIEYMVRAERPALLEWGLDEALVDEVLAQAATYPGADPRWDQP